MACAAIAADAAVTNVVCQQTPVIAAHINVIFIVNTGGVRTASTSFTSVTATCTAIISIIVTDKSAVRQLKSQ